jgi:type II secretory pathway component GspD/PulD (secretin)
VGVSGGASKGDVTVRAGDDAPPSAAAVKASSERSETTVTARQELLVLSGSRAAISVAQHTPHADWFWTWGGDRGLWNVQPGASLVVQPTVIPDDMIRLRITPRFSYYVDGTHTETEVAELATEVVLSDGSELDVGGMPLRDSEFYDRFLTSYDRSGETQRLEIRVSAKIQ